MKIIITIEGDDCELVQVNDTTSKKEVSSEVSMYARWFNETCKGWSKDAELNRMFLETQQRFANERLKAQGYLFLNDVYDMLGMPRTKKGCIVGWIYDEKNPVGDNYVDFDLLSDRNQDFINGYERTVLLDFNVDGYILDAI